jgi:hypothetical protein
MSAAPDLNKLSAPRLDEVAKRIQRANADGAVGPTRSAALIVDLVDHWDERGYREQAECDGKSWVNKTLGNPSATARAYALRDAVEALAALGFDRDATLATKLHHEVLFRLAHLEADDAARARAVNAVLSAQRARGAGVLLTMRQSEPVIDKAIGRKRRHPKADRVATLLAHIERLNALLRAAGVEPPPLP